MPATKYLTGERAADAKVLLTQILQRAFQIAAIAHKPDTAAGGTHRSFDNGRKFYRIAQLADGFHDYCCRLWQAQLVEQPAESGLAMCGAIIGKTRQRHSDTSRQALEYAREQKSLFVDWQQHVEMPRGQQVFDKGEKPGRIVPHRRTAMKSGDKPRKPRQAVRTGIADFDDMTRKPKDRDRLPRRGAVSLGEQHAERFCSMHAVGHTGHHSTFSGLVS